MLELAATCFKSDQLHVRFSLILFANASKIEPWFNVRAAKASELAVQASLQANDAPIAEVQLLVSSSVKFYSENFFFRFADFLGRRKHFTSKRSRLTKQLR